MSPMKIKIGSRESALAVAQARLVMNHLEKNGIEAELVTMKTTGDIILDKSLEKIGGKGLFVKELDRALLDGSVDITVHSYKDMPMEVDRRLPVVAVSPRENPRDALILPHDQAEPNLSKPIGCSSARRTIQLRRLYPDFEVASLRGNILTRLDKLDGGEYCAIVLAMAGLCRLGLEGRASRIFEPWEMLPSACQGILAVQARDGFDISVFEGFHCREAWDASIAERSFVAALDGGCSSPVAAYAEISGDELTLTGLYIDSAGAERTGVMTGVRGDGAVIGEALAARLKEELC